MFDFLTIKPRVFGLNISDLAIRIIQLKKREKNFKLVSWGETKIPSDLVENGEIKDENKFIELLKQSLKNTKGKKIKTGGAAISLPEKRAYLAIVQLPMMEKEELQPAIIFQAENYIPLPLNEVYLDFQIIPSDSKTKDHSDVLLVAFPKKIINQYLTVLKKAAISPLVFEIESQAIIRVLSKNTGNSFPFFMINFGEDNTIFAIFSDHSLRFSSSIPLSLPNLMKTTGKKEGKITLKEIEPSLNDFCEQIRKYISYYQTYGYPEYPNHDKKEAESKKIEKIVLCGKGANLRGLSEFFSSKLKIPTELAKPWLNILKKETANLSQEEFLGYLTALGLALRVTEKNYD